MQYGEDVIEAVLDRLAEGKSLSEVCRGEGMPSARTVQRWMRADDELAERILQAREDGYFLRAEQAVEAAKAAKDPHAGRLAFDAERWYLGKLSNAFRDKPIAIGAFVGVGGDDAFAAVQGALDQAAACIASSGTSTRAVAAVCEARSGDAAGQLADMAGAGGEGLGQDPDGS